MTGCPRVSLALTTSALLEIRQQPHPLLALPCFQSRFYNVLLIFHRLLRAKRRHSLSGIHGEKCLIRAPLPGNIGKADALDPSSADKIKSIEIGTLLAGVFYWLRVAIAERLFWMMMRYFSKVFLDHLSSADCWWVLGAENSPN